LNSLPFGSYLFGVSDLSLTLVYLSSFINCFWSYTY